MEMLCWNLGNAVTALELWKDTLADEFGAVEDSEHRALIAAERLQDAFLPSLEVTLECLRFVAAGIRKELYEDDL
jgi:hypothetical protein